MIKFYIYKKTKQKVKRNKKIILLIQLIRLQFLIKIYNLKIYNKKNLKIKLKKAKDKLMLQLVLYSIKIKTKKKTLIRF